MAFPTAILSIAGAFAQELCVAIANNESWRNTSRPLHALALLSRDVNNTAFNILRNDCNNVREPNLPDIYHQWGVTQYWQWTGLSSQEHLCYSYETQFAVIGEWCISV